MQNEHERDWFKTWVHFAAGFVVVGMSALFTIGDWLPALLAARVAGCLAGFFLDGFWERFN